MFIYWPLREDLIEPVLNQISDIFYDIYQLPLRLNSWHTVLQQLYQVIDMESMLPATYQSIQFDLTNHDLTDEPPIIFRQGSGPQTDDTMLPILCTTVDVSKLQTTGQAKLVLNKEQVDWLVGYFNGKIKVDNDGDNKQDNE